MVFGCDLSTLVVPQFSVWTNRKNVRVLLPPFVINQDGPIRREFSAFTDHGPQFFPIGNSELLLFAVPPSNRCHILPAG